MGNSTEGGPQWSNPLNLFVQNICTSKTILGFYVSHYCGNQGPNAITGTNLAPGATSGAVVTNTQSGHNDYFTVSVMWTDGNQGSTNFYCNSDSDDASVTIQIGDSDCNCNYYESNNGSGVVDTSCNNKGSWTS